MRFEEGKDSFCWVFLFRRWVEVVSFVSFSFFGRLKLFLLGFRDEVDFIWFWGVFSLMGEIEYYS